MKLISFTSLRSLAFVLLLGGLLNVALFSQETDKVKSELFREIDAAMNSARQEEAPILSPNLYAKARELYRRADAEYKKGERLSKIRKRIAEAAAALKEAVDAAEVTKVALAEILEARGTLAEHAFVRKLASKKWSQAENNFGEAIKKAEKGDVRGARGKAKKAIKTYREATVEAVEKGPLKEAEARMRQSKKKLSKKQFGELAREMKSLRSAIRKAKNQEFQISTWIADIRDKINAVTQRAVISKGTRARANVQRLAVHGPFEVSARQFAQLPQVTESDLKEESTIHEFEEITPSRKRRRGFDPRKFDSDFELPPNLLTPLVTNWEINLSSSGIDPQIAVSSTHVVTTFLRRILIYTKDGTLAQSTTTISLFSSLLPDINANLNVPDPKYNIDWFYDARIIFDEFRGRFWLLSATENSAADVDKTASSEADITYRRDKFVVAVSKTENPLDGWYLYWWDALHDTGVCNNEDETPGTYQCPGSSFSPGDQSDFPFIGISERYFMATIRTHGAKLFGGSPPTKYIFLTVASADELASGVPQGQYDAWEFSEINYPGTNDLVKKSILNPAVHHGSGELGLGLSFLASIRVEAPADDEGLWIWRLTENTPPVLYGRKQRVKPWKGPSKKDNEFPEQKNSVDVNNNVLHPHQLQPSSRFVMKTVFRNGNLYATWPDCKEWGGETPCEASVRLVRVNFLDHLSDPNQLPSIDRTFGKRHHLQDPPDASIAYFWPAVEVNKFGNMVIAYIRSGETIWPEARFSTYFAGESDIRPSYLLHKGEFPIGSEDPDYKVRPDKKPKGRLDLTGISVDPFDDTAVWVLHGYGTPKGSSATATKGKWKFAVGKVFGDLHPDLTIKGFKFGGLNINIPTSRSLVSVSSFSPGQLISGSIEIANQGDGAAQAPDEGVEVRLVLSKDQTYSPDDAVIMQVNLASSIASAGTSAMGIQVYMPDSLPVSYYVLAVVDPNNHIEEYSETNNSAGFHINRRNKNR